MSRKNPSYSCFGFFKEVYGEKEKRKQKKKRKKVNEEKRMIKK